ncbi:hypothetical protein Pan97_12650 [Bremerella volcania]|uniref:Transmembrane protein n=1 Tax=Bremerella volcania TaxID=2527984 RepID=A0A518C4V1_9BACT|nr:hypothetical protein Pan97_12650 [Bremerella volcania]
MDEPSKSDESLADVPPTPVTAPPTHSANNFGLNALVLAAAGAGAFFLIGGTMTPCMGATRSTQLQWQERNAQIEQAECDARARESQSE